MTQGPDTPTWLAWLAGIGALMGTLYTLLARLFVTNRELQRILDAAEKRREEQRLQLHNENLENFRGVFDRLSRVEQSQARTEGMLSGRYPRVDR